MACLKSSGNKPKDNDTLTSVEIKQSIETRFE